MITSLFVKMVFSNAWNHAFLGLPNTFGDYDETPDMMATQLKVKDGLSFGFLRDREMES